MAFDLGQGRGSTYDNQAMNPAAAGNASNLEYPPEEWRITGELIRQIGAATTWQRVVEAGDALMTVSRMAKSLRDEQHQSMAKGMAVDAARQAGQINSQAVGNSFDLAALRGVRNGSGY